MTMAVDTTLANALICCPHCRKPSDSVKQLRIMMLIFLIVGFQVRAWNAVGCSACLRQAILRNLKINVLTANVMWPFMILPFSIVQLIRAGRKGHSKSVLRLLL